MVDERFDSLQDAMRAHGLEPPPIIEPGKFYRFPGHGKGPSNRAGYCKSFEDGLGGIYGDFSTSLSETWQVRRDQPYTPEERAEFQRKVASARAEAERERANKQAQAAERADAIWRPSEPATDSHPYSARKGITPLGAKVYKGSLVLRIVDFNGAIWSLQFIHPDGAKRMLTGGRKKGCFILVAGAVAPPPSRLIISEGWATGCTLAEDEPASTVLAAIDAENLEPVAVAARQRCPATEIIIAGDDDRQTEGNPGRTKAIAAAHASNALVAFPEWREGCPDDLTDFNDLVVWLRSGGAS